MALPSEPKMKLNLKSGFPISGQAASSPPVGLKINHGRPNYTINRGVSRNGSIRVNESLNQANPFGVILKKTSSPITPPTTPTLDNSETVDSNGNVSPPPISPKPVTVSKTFSTPTRTTPINQWTPTSNGPKEPSQVILRSTSRASNYSNGSQNGDDEEPEFLRAHRKMAAKISNVDYDEINKNRNSYTEIMNVSSSRIISSPTVPEIQSVPEVEATPEAAAVEVIENGHHEEEHVAEEEAVVSNGHVKEEVVEHNGHVEEEVVEHNGHVEEVVKHNGHVEEVVEHNGHVEENVEEVVTNSNVEEIQENGEKSSEDKPFFSFAEQLNDLMARGPTHLINGNEESTEESQEDLRKQIDETIEEAVKEVEKQNLVDENGNTLPEDLAKLKFDIQEDQQDITVTTTVVH